jgi:hypothetical protein
VTVLETKNASFTMLSNVCGDIIGEEPKDTEEEISVNEDSVGNNIFPTDLLTIFWTKMRVCRMENLTTMTSSTTPILTGTQQMGPKKEERKRRKRRSICQTKKRLV